MTGIMLPPARRCGSVVLVGRPNAGKSTLLNQLVGQRLSATSPRPQTTRNSILGIKTHDNFQIIYLDTPGFYKGNKSALSHLINKNAEQALQGVDAAVFVADAKRWTSEDGAVLARLSAFSGPVYLAINKVDLIKPRIKLLPFIEKCRVAFNFSDIIPLSSKTGENIKALEQAIEEKLPEQEFLYPEDQVTDKSVRFIAAEFIREEIIRITYAEIPYSVFVEIESFNESKNLVSIDAKIYVERESQKNILIGSEGLNLKKIGTNARYKLQKIVGKKIGLSLWVNVKEKWTNDPSVLKKIKNS